MALTGIFHDFPRLILRVISAIRRTITNRTVASDHGFRAITANSCQQRILLNLNTPPLIFREMPVKAVHIVHSHKVNDFLDKLNREEMTTAIKHHSSISKARSIDDFHRRKVYKSRLSHRQSLAKSLNSIENTCCRTPLYGNTFLTHRKRIAFIMLYITPNHESDNITS